ncbi:hypothetical protein [Okeania sp. SIO3B5]|uniref:hypothetical protein n=1 Tax=Okeania sp. SIO3B5 TaxID=2607811 RepID=UPI0025E8E0B7|nr:hypothetical protein [Okeania sp. SIO3B5]
MIAVENLNIRGLAKNTKLSKSIYDVAWVTFLSKQSQLKTNYNKCHSHRLKKINSQTK